MYKIYCRFCGDSLFPVKYREDQRLKKIVVVWSCPFCYTRIFRWYDPEDKKLPDILACIGGDTDAV